MTDEGPELIPHVRAEVDQIRAGLVDEYPELFGPCPSCTLAEALGWTWCPYHRGVHDALHAALGHVGDVLLDAVRLTETEAGPVCEGARAVIGIVGSQHVAWLEQVTR